MKTFVAFSKTAFFTFLIGYASSIVAQNEPRAKKQPPSPVIPVTLSSPSYTFEMYFSGLALQPFANNLDYAAEALPFNYGDAQPAVSPSWVIPVISPDFHFGFDVGVAGVFESANSNLMLNWERFHSSNDSDSIVVDSSNNMVGTFFEIGPDASDYKQGKGTVSFHFDEVNLNYGTFVNFGSLLHMNLFSGVGFTRLVQHRFTTISNLSETTIRTLDVPAKFIGAGPQLGLNFQYKIACGFQFVGMTRGTLFVGNFKNHTTFTTASQDLVDLGDQSPNVQSTSVHKKTGIVPGFEGKLGFAYEYLFRQHYALKVEAGYQAQIYINAIRSVDMGSEVALGMIGSVGTATTGVYARTFQRTVSDFGLAGPYATLNLAF